MKYSLVFILSALAIALGMSLPHAVTAQGESTGFRNMWLKVYPEYDDPRLLVMLEGKVEGASIPATVRFLVPQAAEMYSAGSIDAQGKYTGGPPARKPSSIPGWDEISYQVTSDTFRVEYYDPIIRGFPDKTISDEFRTLYPISGLVVYVQEPRNSSNFNVLPGSDSKVTQDDLPAYLYRYDSLAADKTLRYEISYVRSDTKPSLSTQQGGGPSNAQKIALWVIGGVAIVGIGLWLAMSRRGRRRSPPRKSGAGVRPTGRFCRQCGKRLEGSARFCQDVLRQIKLLPKAF